MGVLKNVIASGLAYAEEKQVPKYVSTLRSSWKPCDSVIGQVETLLNTHGPSILDKADLKVELIHTKAKETYGDGIKKGTEVVSYAKQTKDGVVSYALDKKTTLLDTASKTKATSISKAMEIKAKVQSGELKKDILKKLEKQPVAASVATQVVALLTIATALPDTLKVKADAHVKTAKALYASWCVRAKACADTAIAKLPVSAAQEKVAKVEKQVRAYLLMAKQTAKPYTEKLQDKTAPYIKLMKPYVTKAKIEATKVYTKLFEYKTAFMKKYA
jgi:hypothetical protein